MVEKFQTERLPRESISFSVPIEDIVAAATAPVQKKKNNPLPKNNVVLVFLMGHQEMAEGWRFSEPSWGVRVDDKVQGIFPDPHGREEAEKLAKTLAIKLSRVVHVVE